ncbi:MAG: discoidin domain-containing protein [Deltaproteobacteria bacterium]|nr:discoidin domain-containing protein [Deltaproteobacteria bacterium]
MAALLPALFCAAISGCESGDAAVVGTTYADLTYAFAPKTGCGAWCYYDEAHNLASTASETDDSGIDRYAAGQLVDGRRGVDAWDEDLGFGPGYEWVGWIDGKPEVRIDLGQRRSVRRVRVGMSNHAEGGVTQASVIRVATSLDGQAWSAETIFARGDGSLASITPGKRADVSLGLQSRDARYVRLTFVRTGWLMLDEIGVE